MGGTTRNGAVPFSSTSFVEHFEKVTRNQVCVMGIRTYFDVAQDQPDKKTLLDGRDTYVISKQEYDFKGVTQVPDLHTVLTAQQDSDRAIFILGDQLTIVESLAYRPPIHLGVLRDGINHGCDETFPIATLNSSAYKISVGREFDDCWIVTYKHT